MLLCYLKWEVALLAAVMSALSVACAGEPEVVEVTREVMVREVVATATPMPNPTATTVPAPEPTRPAPTTTAVPSPTAVPPAATAPPSPSKLKPRWDVHLWDDEDWLT